MRFYFGYFLFLFGSKKWMRASIVLVAGLVRVLTDLLSILPIRVGGQSRIHHYALLISLNDHHALQLRIRRCVKASTDRLTRSSFKRSAFHCSRTYSYLIQHKPGAYGKRSKSKLVLQRTGDSALHTIFYEYVCHVYAFDSCQQHPAWRLRNVSCCDTSHQTSCTHTDSLTCGLSR